MYSRHPNLHLTSTDVLGARLKGVLLGTRDPGQAMMPAHCLGPTQPMEKKSKV